MIPVPPACDQPGLAGALTRDPVARRYRAFFALLDWRLVPERDAGRPGSVAPEWACLCGGHGNQFRASGGGVRSGGCGWPSLPPDARIVCAHSGATEPSVAGLLFAALGLAQRWRDRRG